MADPRFTFHVLLFTVLESEARTKLAGFFSILPVTVHPPIVSTTRNRALPLSM